MKTGSRATAVLGAIAAITGAGLAAGVSTTVANQPERAGASSSLQRSVSANRAGQIAKKTIQTRTGQSARVVRVDRRNAYGAMWDVTVRTSSGKTFDVYVEATGRVSRVEKAVTTSQSW